MREKYIYLTSADGLFHEMYRPSELPSKCTVAPIISSGIDASACFWAEIFDKETVRDVINIIVSAQKEELQRISYQNIVSSNPKLFFEKVMLAKDSIVEQSNTPLEYYSYIETLNIYCHIYCSIYHPGCQLTIQDGFVLNESSSKYIYEQCLALDKNPYLRFAREVIIPSLQQIAPMVIFFSGKPSLFFACVSRYIKEILPDTHICFTRHSSEYYSLNKIDEYLEQNDYLFQIADSVIMEYFENTELLLVDAITNNAALNDIPNLAHKTQNGRIVKNEYSIPENYGRIASGIQRPRSIKTYTIPPNTIADVHFEPLFKCYWNRCAFCGINKKYHFNDYPDAPGSSERLFSVQKLIQRGIDYIWFIDEAIRPDKLELIADYFVQSNISVIWQARCRIDKGLLKGGLAAKLHSAGLRELRLGLESASPRTLKRMRKFEDDFSLETVKSICHVFSSQGISIHFPVIVGFPGESSTERKMTYDYLTELIQEYRDLTFNINIFGLDIKSDVFRNPDLFEIKEVSLPCPASELISNSVPWSSDGIVLETIAEERDAFMRDKMYPWMPHHSITRPYIFYRLSETIRNTLVWKSSHTFTLPHVSANELCMLKTSGDLSIYYDTQKKGWLVYNWFSHHYLVGNEYVLEVLKEFETGTQICAAVQNLVEKNPKVFSKSDLLVLIQRMFENHFFQIK